MCLVNFFQELLAIVNICIVHIFYLLHKLWELGSSFVLVMA